MCSLHSLNKLFQFMNILIYSALPRYQEQKQSQWNWRKRQRWIYLTTLQLYINWKPHWPRVILKMHSGVLFHRLHGKINNSQSHEKRMLMVIFQSFALILLQQTCTTYGPRTARAFSIVENVAKTRPQISDCRSRISSTLRRNLHIEMK